MLGRIRSRYLLAALVATTVGAGCAGSDDEATPTTVMTTVVTSEPEPAGQPGMTSVDAFLSSWAAVAVDYPQLPDLAPTISSADVETDPTIGVDVFVEQATSHTVIGGIVDPDSGVVTGLMGLSEPDNDEALAMIEIIWVSAFGSDDEAMMDELFPVEEIRALQIGDQMTRIHRERSVVMNHTVGADPEGGLYVFTVGDEELVEEDPSHDSITNVVLGLLVRTA